jgi:hypothetical protein
VKQKVAMSSMLVAGLLCCAGSIVFLISAAVRKGPMFEYAWALFIGELGLVQLAGEIIAPGKARIGVQLCFALGMIMTAALWVRLFRDFQRRGNSTVGMGDPRMSA